MVDTFIESRDSPHLPLLGRVLKSYCWKRSHW